MMLQKLVISEKSLVSASGAGLAISLVSEGLKVKPAHALSTAAVFAVVSGTIYKVSETIKSHNAQDAFYTETRVMLSKLGLEEYEKNFKKGHLTDPTLPFLTDSVLQEVNIPPGPRLLILDHIQRFEYKLLYSYMDQIYEI
uniref:SAM domain-containing protein n=1 Tax=Brassica campestris TaxID=3711 RepID=M4FIY5_BRACM